MVVLLGKAVVIAGTPGTGKSSVCKEISETCGLRVVNLSQVAVEKGFVVMYDERRDTYVIDENKLANYIADLVKSSSGIIVIQTHYPEIVPRELVEAVYVLRTHPLVLEKRLLERGWSTRKINENVMAEILGVVVTNALMAFGEERVFEVETTNTRPEEVANLICSAIKGLVKLKPGVRIDWLSVLDPETVIKFEKYLGEED